MKRVEQQWREYKGTRNGFQQVLDFIIHFRLHYQFGILSGGYLLAALFQPEPNWTNYVLQFINVHVLLFGTATAYNSFWDKDEGAIGGLQQPPPMSSWMWWASWGIQLLGLLWAYTVGISYLLIYGFSVLLFWLYSTPLARWKSKPIKSLWAIALSTGTNSFLLGYLASGHNSLAMVALITAIGVALILISMYPISQIFQTEEDRKRGDHTFAVVYGIRGVRLFYGVCYALGLMAVSYGLLRVEPILGWIFAVAGLTGGLYTGYLLYNLVEDKQMYATVMRIKYASSMLFNVFILAAIVWVHG